MSDAELLLVAAPLAGLSGLVLSHAVLRRALPERLFVPVLTAFGAGGGLALALSTAAVRDLGAAPADGAARALLNTLTYLALGFGYFNFVNLNVTSLRIRLLRELLERRPEGLSRAELLTRYGAAEVVRLRLERLTGTGHLVRRGDRYYTGRRGVVLLARLFDLLTRLVLPARARRGPLHAESSR